MHNISAGEGVEVEVGFGVPPLTAQEAEKKLKRVRTERRRELSFPSAHYFPAALRLYPHLYLYLYLRWR